MTAHEVCYHPTDLDSPTYKVYLEPFNSGLPEEWLEHLSKLQLVLCSNNLNTDPAKFNLMHALLKGNTLHVFNAKTAEFGNETAANYTESLWAMMTHTFLTQALACQKWYMCNYVKWMKEITIVAFALNGPNSMNSWKSFHHLAELTNALPGMSNWR